MATIDIKKREDADLNHPDLAPAGTGWDKDWTLLVEPKDWTTRLTGRGSNLAWRGEHLARESGPPAFCRLRHQVERPRCPTIASNDEPYLHSI